MQEHTNQLVAYIRQGISRGMTDVDIREKILLSGWAQNDIDDAFRIIHAQQRSNTALKMNQKTSHQPMENNPKVKQISKDGAKKKQTKNVEGILWILFPFILLIGTATISATFRIIGFKSPVITVITILSAMVGMIFIPIGIIIGFIKLTRH